MTFNINEEYFKKLGIPILRAQAEVTYPKGHKFSPAGLDFDATEYGNLVLVKDQYPHWCLWAGDVDALINWILANEKIRDFKVVKSADARSLWAFPKKEDAQYFAQKFEGAEVNFDQATYS